MPSLTGGKCVSTADGWYLTFPGGHSADIKRTLYQPWFGDLKVFQATVSGVASRTIDFGWTWRGLVSGSGPNVSLSASENGAASLTY